MARSSRRATNNIQVAAWDVLTAQPEAAHAVIVGIQKLPPDKRLSLAPVVKSLMRLERRLSVPFGKA